MEEDDFGQSGGDTFQPLSWQGQPDERETQSVRSAHSAHSVHSAHSGADSVHSYHSQHGAGMSSLDSAAADIISLKRDREREGRCSECGAQTHEFRVNPRTGARTKEPLTVANEVHRGRCLLCYPIPGAAMGGGSSQASFQSPMSQASFQSKVSHSSHRSLHSAQPRITAITPDATTSTSSFHSAPPGHGRGTHYSSRSIGSDTRTSGGASGRSVTAHHRAFHLPDAIESSSVASASAASVASAASASSATKFAAEQVAIEEVLTSFETETADLCDILAAMRRFPHSVRVQEQGCEKLWIQSWDDENSSAIGRVGGVPTIIHAMRAHLASAHLQQCGCEALQNLALNEFNREIIAEHDGIAAIIGAMGRHWDVPGVQQCACSALANVASDSEDKKVIVTESGGLHAILRAVQTFPADEAVLRSAYQALRSLGYNPTAELERAQQQQRSGGSGEDTEMGNGR